jgi:hypothetical protein
MTKEKIYVSIFLTKNVLGPIVHALTRMSIGNLAISTKFSYLAGLILPTGAP